MAIAWGQLETLLEGAGLVLLGFILTMVYQAWRDKRLEHARRERIRNYIRLELQKGGTEARGLITTLTNIIPGTRTPAIVGITNDAWRVAASDLSACGLNTETLAALSEASYRAGFLNQMIASYELYSNTQGAMTTYQQVMNQMVLNLIASANSYIASAERVVIPAA